MNDSRTRTGRIVGRLVAIWQDGSRDSDRTSARNPRLRARALVIDTWLPALRGAVTVRQGRWLPEGTT